MTTSQLSNTTAATKSLGFSGHQTFPFRYGWLTKAVDSAAQDASVFRRDDALVTLGVGKNMVESIRHWSLATQLLRDSDRGRVFELSEWADLLFGNGYDYFLEDPASLWLVHWLLVTNPLKAGTWHLAFNHFQYPEFRKETLVSFVLNYAARHQLKVNERTIERDVDCFVRTYTPSRVRSHKVLEDTFSCPLVELGILQLQPDDATYQFSIGPKSTLPAEVVAVALDRFFDIAGGSRKTLSLQECLYHPESPGQVFKLDYVSLVEYVEQLQVLTHGAIAADETAGLQQLYRRGAVHSQDLLEGYYRRQSI